ncbi:MAG: hypothetical protein LQ351_001063 [Letrouitia transgressa]|nr:MAG: hypothetical protein LQ351_001063 [Letrouitia transgressa]
MLLSVRPRSLPLICGVETSSSNQDIAVLEDAGMAYPNAVMWCSTQSLPHVHSPHQESHHLATTVTPSRISDDPFVENGRHQTHKRGRRASSSDQSIPDYSYSVTPRSSRNISLQDVPKAACMWTLESQSQSQLEELMAALSPNKASGTYAPANTTATSRVNTPATAVKPSAAAKARAVSYYGQPHVGSAKLRDMNPLAKLNLPDQRLENLEHGHGNIKQTPTEEVKSRKEGKIHDAGSTKPGQRKVAVGPSSHQDPCHSF